MTPKELIFPQAIATTSLMTVLSNNNFLESDYYKNTINIEFEDDIRKVLGESGIGNPATLQMFFYALLVLPKEILDNDSNTILRKNINKLFLKVECKIKTTYDGEDENDKTTINFYNHIRNAIAHSNCDYKAENRICYVTFGDKKGKKQECKITMTTADAGLVLMKLVELMNAYLNRKCKTEVFVSASNFDVLQEPK